MDKLHKFGVKLWRNKERMILVLLLCVLGFRVYQLVNPPPPPEPKPHSAPRASIPDDWPDGPPVPEEGLRSVEMASGDALLADNPFTRLASTSASATKKSAESDATQGLKLVRVTESKRDGSISAMISVSGVTKRVQQGDEVKAGVRVQRIDVQAGTVELSTPEAGGSITLSAK